MAAALANTNPSEKVFHVVIDPGHGGNDAGAVKNNLKESILVLDLAQKIETLIQKYDPTITVELTRRLDTYLSLEERIKGKMPDLFVSLHANSSISSRVMGMETYFQPEQKSNPRINSSDLVQSIIEDLEHVGKTNHSLLFSQKLQNEWSASPSVIRRSAFYVVQKTNYPSVLIEIGFLTNAEEAKKLNSAAYQNEIAQTIAKTIAEYKKSIQ